MRSTGQPGGALQAGLEDTKAGQLATVISRLIGTMQWNDELRGCKVLMAVVGMFKDQVRWLRLRAGCSKRGFGRFDARSYSPHTTGELGLDPPDAGRSGIPELP